MVSRNRSHAVVGVGKRRFLFFEALFICSTLALMSFPAFGAAFKYIRIGDVDSFGFTDLGLLTGATGNPVDRDGDGILGDGDTLPDLDGDGSIDWRGDNFDNRSVSERFGDALTTAGATDFAGCSGSDWTDIAVSRSWTENPGMQPGDQPGFIFDFYVDGDSVDPTAELFVNVILADYGADPARVRYTSADGEKTTRNLQTRTVSGTKNDGFVQSAFITLTFEDVFAPETGGYRGYLAVDFLAPEEPYTAYDFAEISVVPIPEPAGILSLGLGSLLYLRRRTQRTDRL